MQQKYSRRTTLLSVITGACVLGSLTAAVGQEDESHRWRFGGGDIFNTRNAAGESDITAANVRHLKVKWAFPTHGDVSATPTVEAASEEGTAVYAVDWGGYLYRINGDTGVPTWAHPLSDYTGSAGSVSRTSPAIHGNLVIIGDQGGVNSAGFANFTSTASVMAINKHNGKLVWRSVVSNHPFSVITSSPVVDQGVIYCGVSSLEENAGFITGYGPFTWRGKVVALDAATGKLLWTFETISADPGARGYTGASVRGSTPVVDHKRGSLYVTTGNNYSVPPGVGPNAGESPADPNDHIDSVLALDLSTGHLKWATRTRDTDTWDVYSWILKYVFGYSFPDLGLDYDFGSGANLFTAFDPHGHRVDLLGAGEKSGQYWALDPDTGAIQWVQQVGPGGTGGGIEWGSATDGRRVYCAIANSDSQPTGLTPEKHGGLWAALDAYTGNILWQTVDPVTRTPDGQGGHDFGMVTVANGVVFTGSTGVAPTQATPGVPGGFFALDAATGQILWQYATDGAVICGPSVVDGTVYWGSGYSHLANAFGISGTPTLYAFSLK